MTLTPRSATAATVRTFKQAGDGTQQGSNTIYRFTVEPRGPIAYRPGDGLKLEVPVRSGEQRYVLIWDESGTRTFQFDCLSREPKLVPASGAAEPATGVTLIPGAGSNLPRVPVFLPEVRR